MSVNTSPLPPYSQDISVRRASLLLVGIVCVFFIFYQWTRPTERQPIETHPNPPDIYERCRPCIVTIYSEWSDQEPLPWSVSGTGFIVSGDGYIVTAGHVVRQRGRDGGGVSRRASTVYVTLYAPQANSSRAVHVARIVAIDGRADVAVLKIDGFRDLPTLDIPDNDSGVQAGSPVLVIGNAFGLDSHSLSEGIVRNPRWKDPRVQNLLTSLLTSAPTAKGVSGAPILDRQGVVIGIHTSAFHPMTLRKAGNTSQMISQNQNAQPEQTEQTASVEKLTVESNEVVTDLVQPPRPASPGPSEEAVLSTHFGGGLVGPILRKLVYRCIAHDRGEQTIPIYTLEGYALTQKCLPGFAVLPNTIENRLKLYRKTTKGPFQPFLPVLPDSVVNSEGDRGYLIVAMDAVSPVGPRVGDVLTQIDENPVGLRLGDASIGDHTWFLGHGERIHLQLYRDGERLECEHSVTTLPTVLDIPVNDPQFIGLIFVAMGITFMVAGAVGAAIAYLAGRKEEPSRIPTEVRIETEGSYRMLETTLAKYQVDPTRTWYLMSDLVVSFMSAGMRRTITVPANYIFDGDLLKNRLNIESTSVVWAVHAWIYDSEEKENRWMVDELLYELLAFEGYTHRGDFPSVFNDGVQEFLEERWDETPSDEEKTIRLPWTE